MQTINAPKVSEAQFQKRVIDLARMSGWRVAHFRPAQTTQGWRTAMIGDPGFVDLVMVKDGRCLFRELKVDGGRLSAAQSEWLIRLQNAGMDAGVWRPEQWEAIVATLASAALRDRG